MHPSKKDKVVALATLISLLAQDVALGMMSSTSLSSTSSTFSSFDIYSPSSARSLLDQAMRIRRKRQLQQLEHEWNDDGTVTVSMKKPSPVSKSNVFYFHRHQLLDGAGADVLDDLFSETSSSALNASLKKQRQLQERKRRVSSSSSSLSISLLDEDETDDDDDNDDDNDDGSMLQRVHQQNIVPLTQAASRHVDVPDAELQLQMEAARKRAASKIKAQQAAFIHHVASRDATSSEKLAMKVIPMQLPAPLAKVVSKMEDEVQQKRKQNNKIKVTKLTKPTCLSTITSSGPSDVCTGTAKESKSRSVKNNKKSKKKLLSHEEEMELVKIIHEGARVNVIKVDFETKHGRDISRSEWAELANLSQKELRRLVSEYRDAKSKLVVANMGLVHAVVKTIYKRDFNESRDRLDELVQEGSLGLIRAAELFDPSRGLRFSTYATLWIKGVLSNSKAHQFVVIPRREKNKFSSVSRTMKEYEAEHGRQPTTEEIARVCGMREQDVEELLDKMSKTRNVLSLDHKYSSTSKSGSISSSENDAELYGDKALLTETDLAETIQMKADVVAALVRNLDSREARLMRLRYGLKDGKTRSLVECAEAMGISRQRAQQLAAGCLKKLREADEARSLQEYLLTVA